MVIRHPTLDEAHTIAAMHMHVWRIAYAHLVSPDVFTDDLQMRSVENWHRRIESDAGHTWLACDGDQLVGFTVTGLNRDQDVDAMVTTELYALYVHPDRWRSGIGRTLVNHALDAARHEGFADITLWVLRDNPRARAAYEAMGFTLDAVEPKTIRFLGVELPEVRYRLSL